MYVYCPELVNPFFLHVYFGMEEYALGHDYQIFLTRTFDRGMICQGRFDGFLFPVYNSSEVMDGIHFLRDMNLPFVISDFQDILRNDIPTVSVNVEGAGWKAADHLLELGHDDILFATATIDPKWVGIQRCCASRGRRASLFLFSNGEGKIRNYFNLGAQCAQDIARMAKVPTAIIAANDEIAVGLINGLTRLGYHVPNDISVIGFDDAYIAAYSNPSLTTIHYPKTRIGMEMAKMLIGTITGAPVDTYVQFETEFVLRESTASPRNP